MSTSMSNHNMEPTHILGHHLKKPCKRSRSLEANLVRHKNHEISSSPSSTNHLTGNVSTTHLFTPKIYCNQSSASINPQNPTVYVAGNMYVSKMITNHYPPMDVKAQSLPIQGWFSLFTFSYLIIMNYFI